MNAQPPQDDRHPYAPSDEPVNAAQGNTTGQQQSGQQEQPAAAPANEPMTLSQAKSNVCKKLTQIFTSPLMNERLLKMTGGDPSRVAKNLTAFLSIITQDDGGGKTKKYYYQCSIPSLTSCFLESMNMQLPFDSRKLVSMVIYDWEAELDISYKGFVNALNRHYRNAFVECKLVFEGDKFEPDINGRVATYAYKPKDAFAVVTKDFAGIRGGYCFFSYTDTDGQPTSRLVFLSREQILKNRSRAKQTYVWDSDPKAMGEKTCIREGARLPFASIDLDVDMEEVDNRHYQLEKPEGGDRLKLLMAAQEEVVNGPVQSKPDGGTVEENKGDKPLSATASPPDKTQAGAVGNPADTNAGQAASNPPAGAQAGGASAAQAPAEAKPPGDNAGGQTVVAPAPSPSPAGSEAPKLPITDADFEEVKP